jgi:hypothetical protein
MGKYDSVDHLGQAVELRIAELGLQRADRPWDLLGTSEASLSRWRRGKQQIGGAHLEAVRLFLGVTDAEWGRLRVADDYYFGAEGLARAQEVRRALVARLRTLRPADGS